MVCSLHHLSMIILPLMRKIIHGKRLIGKSLKNGANYNQEKFWCPNLMKSCKNYRRHLTKCVVVCWPADPQRLHVFSLNHKNHLHSTCWSTFKLTRVIFTGKNNNKFQQTNFSQSICVRLQDAVQMHHGKTNYLDHHGQNDKDLSKRKKKKCFKF